MEFKFGNRARFTPIAHSSRIEYYFDRKDLCVRSHTLASGKNKKIKDAEVFAVSHGLYQITFNEMTVEVYRGKLVAPIAAVEEAIPTGKNVGYMEDKQPSAVKIVEAIQKKEITEVKTLLKDNDPDVFTFMMNLTQVDFTEHFMARIRQRGSDIFTEMELSNQMLFENRARAWVIEKLLVAKPYDVVIANKMVYVGSEQRKAWTQSILIGKYTLIIETWKERTKVVSFMDRSKTILERS